MDGLESKVSLAQGMENEAAGANYDQSSAFLICSAAQTLPVEGRFSSPLPQTWLCRSGFKFLFLTHFVLYHS